MYKFIIPIFIIFLSLWCSQNLVIFTKLKLRFLKPTGHLHHSVLWLNSPASSPALSAGQLKLCSLKPTWHLFHSVLWLNHPLAAPIYLLRPLDQQFLCVLGYSPWWQTQSLSRPSLFGPLCEKRNFAVVRYLTLLTQILIIF